MQILKRASGSACKKRLGMCQMSRWRMGGWKENVVGKRGGGGDGVLNVSSEERLQKGRRKRHERVKSKQQIFLVNSPVSDPVDLTLRHQTDRTGSGSPSGPRLPLPWVNPFTSPPLPLSPASLLPLHVSPRGLPVAFVINRGMSWLRRHLMFYRGSQGRHPRFRARLFMQTKVGPIYFN